MQRSGFKIMSK